MGIKFVVLVKYLIFRVYLELRESLYTQVNTLLNHIDIRVILPRYKGS